MNMRLPFKPQPGSAFSLLELLITVGLASIVLAMVTVLYLFSLRSFGSMGNYAEMDAQSRLALDIMSREIRQSGQVIAIQNSGTVKWLRVASTNAYTTASTNKFTWDQNAATLLWEKTGETPRVLLTGCEKWDLAMFQRAPEITGNWNFTTTTNQGLCKLINMSWKCSRTNIIKKFNTESMVTAQIVMRNKQ